METIMRATLLIIENNTNIRNAIAEICASEGYDIEWTDNQEGALDLCRTVSFDAAVVNAELPGVDGANLLKQLLCAQPEIKCLVTAISSEDQANLIRWLKASEHQRLLYLLETFRKKDIVKTIRRLIQNSNEKG
ncbi:MAG: response regulator [Candidatus Latescibacteria bacterium]|nr:response regulator [Candidatus Latescibacterota bacterium]